MAQVHVIGRTEKVKQIRALLKETQIIYVSSFFYSGKTMLLDQLAQSLKEPVLRFSVKQGGTEGWAAFVREAEEHPDAVLLVDDLQRLLELQEEAGSPGISLRSFLVSLPRTQRVVLAGRGKIPAQLQTLVMTGEAVVLDKSFVLFTEEETEQLFLEYGVELPAREIAYVQAETWGMPFVLQAVARRKAASPERSVRALVPEILGEIEKILIREVMPQFSGDLRDLLFRLSPFARFEEEMARTVTGRDDAPALIRRVEERSYVFIKEGRGQYSDQYSIVPIVRKALFGEMKNLYPADLVGEEYRRAAVYCEEAGNIPEAVFYYTKLEEVGKIRDLLIRDTHMRPGNGDYVALREAYRVLPREMVLESPELMKGMCMVESLQGHVQESRQWYEELAAFLKNCGPGDPRRLAAEEALAYLDIAVPHTGSRNILRTLRSFAGMPSLTGSKTWEKGFNVAGNGVSLLSGGKDFSRWVPHGWQIYRIARPLVEKALGSGARGLGDIAIGECELESSLTGDYSLALQKVTEGLAEVAEDLELRCAAVGIQSRILMAEGEIDEAIRLMDSLIGGLPETAPARLRQNLQVHRLTLLMMKGENREALGWMETDSPDENRDFIILDRWCLMLKLRLYIVTGQWARTRLLTVRLAQYFDQYDRPYMRIQLHLLQAIICRRTGRGSWKEEMAAALSLADQYRLLRVIADEGAGVLDMLRDMDLPDGPREKALLRLTRLQAAHYPTYMRPAATQPVFTEREQEVYSLLIAGYKNARIASILNLSERTVKHYATKVYQKLGVRTRAEAISRAAELGDVNR